MTFRSAFQLKGLDQPEPAGAYEVETDEEIIEGNGRTAYRRLATLIFLGGGGATRAVTVMPADLEAAPVRDRDA